MIINDHNEHGLQMIIKAYGHSKERFFELNQCESMISVILSFHSVLQKERESKEGSKKKRDPTPHSDKQISSQRITVPQNEHV